jgi:PhzF family phenazine biosynthesis protein|tara:strand:- start:636 stop:1421 length:786 start_codon:yes stop_codon:yes gene_type:complete
LLLPIYIIDAFTDKVFKGNPAAVIPLDNKLDSKIMQAIASENNLSETAYVNISSAPFSIRWFTPTIEVDLCGHATLATARVLFDFYLPEETTEILFSSRSGELKAFKKEKLIHLDFPTDIPRPVSEKEEIARCLGMIPLKIYKGRDDYLAIFNNEKTIKEISPSFEKLSKLDSRGLIVSAPGNQVDFVSRCFFPQTGVNEDPVTGSAHTLMIPYWSKILGKTKLSATQLSSRSGRIYCELHGERVLIGGETAQYLKGEISI